MGKTQTKPAEIAPLPPCAKPFADAMLSGVARAERKNGLLDRLLETGDALLAGGKPEEFAAALADMKRFREERRAA